jgi:hypothetical protein
MELLVFMVVAAAVVVTPLALFLARTRLRPGAIRVALIGVASGEAEKNLWVGALGSAGIWVRVRTARWPGMDLGSSPAQYSYEVWVRLRDEERAREVLGL